MAQTLLGNVKGPKGDTGAQGPQGEQGPTGAQGPQGETGPANTAFITDAFSTSQAYNAGDYCIYNNTLYRFAEDKAAGEWDDSKVMSTLIGTELSGLNSRFHSINSSNHVEFADNQAQYTGISATIPANSYYAITGKAEWNVGRANWVGIASSSTLVTSQYAEGTATQSVASCSMCGYTDAEMVLYLWAQYLEAGTNKCAITGFYISA